MGNYNWKMPMLSNSRLTSSADNFMNGLTRDPKKIPVTGAYASRPTPVEGKDPALNNMPMPSLNSGGSPSVPDRGNVWSRNQTMPGEDPALNGVAEAKQSMANPSSKGTTFGMDTNKFAQLAGAMGSAIAPNTPMGRVGANVSKIATQNIKDDYESQERRNRQEWLDSGREDSQAHDLEAETTRQDRYDAREDKSQDRYDTREDKRLNRADARTDKDIAARQAAATERVKLENERIATQNALTDARTAEERKYLEKKMADQNARIDRINKENRDYAEKQFKTKDERDYFRKLTTAQYNEDTGETTPGMAPDSAIKWMAMETRALKEGVKPARGNLAVTNTSQEGLNKGRMSPRTPSTTKAKKTPKTNKDQWITNPAVRELGIGILQSVQKNQIQNRPFRIGQ